MTNAAFMQNGPLEGQMRVGPTGEPLRITLNGVLYVYRWSTDSMRGRTLAMQDGTVIRYYRVHES